LLSYFWNWNYRKVRYYFWKSYFIRRDADPSDPSEVENTWDSRPFEKIINSEFMYFVHSYYACPLNSENVLAVTEYEGLRYCSAVIKENIFATQFHPEKSAIEGIKIYRNWANTIIGN